MNVRVPPVDCPFCQTSVSEAQFAESDNFRAIYNIAPILPGHSLVIPKVHYNSLLDLSNSELCEMVLFSRQVVDVLMRTFNASAFNWTIQQGEVAGQTVDHFHLHLIPRSVGDLPDPGDWYPLLRKSQSELIDSEFRTKLTVQQRSEIVARIRNTIKEVAPGISSEK